MGGTVVSYQCFLVLSIILVLFLCQQVDCFMYQCINNQTPADFCTMFSKNF